MVNPQPRAGSHYEAEQTVSHLDRHLRLHRGRGLRQLSAAQPLSNGDQLMSTRRFLLVFVLGPVLVVLGAVATWAYWTTQGVGIGTASTGTVNAPTAVAASNTPGSPLVAVSWTNSAPAAGVSPAGYYVTRVRNSDGATFNACGSPASPTATTPCNDSGVPDGIYHYLVTGVLASWSRPSASSNIVTTDTTAPTVTGVSSPLADGSYTAGQLIPVTVTFSEVVLVSGTPKLSLSTGTPATTAVNYSTGSGSSVLTFSYTAAAGNTSPDLDYAAPTSLALNAGTIQDLATNTATLTLPAPAAAGSLAANKALVIDSTAPTVSLTSVNGSARTFPFSTNVNVTSIGGTCGSIGGDSTTVSPLINGSATVPATATCSSGAWSITLTTALTTEASRTLSATQTDTAGNIGSATSQTLTIDKTAPVVSVTSVNGSARTFPYSTNVNVTSIGGTCGSIGGDSTTVSPLMNGSATLPATASCISGAWSLALTTALSTQASRTLSATQTDTAGNTGFATSQTLTIDKTAPAAPTAPALTAASDSGSSSTDRITNVTTPTFTGSAEAGATVALYDGVTPVGTAVATGGAYSVRSVALSAGVQTMTVKATDVAGNVGASSTSTSITIDLTAPSLVIGSCTGGSGHKNIVTGTTDDNGPTVSVMIFTGNGTGGSLFTTLTSATPSAGAWSVTTANKELTGGNTYTAQATQVDSAGNTSNQPTCSFTAN
jgi:large repetitive protein